MFMSDPEPKEWQVWRPLDLVVENHPLVVNEGNDEREALEDSDALQMELAQIRHQAEQKGFSQGQSRGLEAGKKQGYEEGLAQGMQDGFAKGLAESQQQQKEITERFSQLLNAFTVSLSNLDSVIPARLVQFALTAARSVLGVSVAYDHSALLDEIRRLLQQETLFSGKVQLRVSRDDFLLVQDSLGETIKSLGWVLCQDENILPGGCHITSEEGEFDATITTRWEELCHLSREDHRS